MLPKCYKAKVLTTHNNTSLQSNFTEYFPSKADMLIYMTAHQPCQKVVGSEGLKANHDSSLKQMQMSQSNREHICLVKAVTLNINKAVKTL